MFACIPVEKLLNFLKEWGWRVRLVSFDVWAATLRKIVIESELDSAARLIHGCATALGVSPATVSDAYLSETLEAIHSHLMSLVRARLIRTPQTKKRIVASSFQDLPLDIQAYVQAANVDPNQVNLHWSVFCRCAEAVCKFIIVGNSSSTAPALVDQIEGGPPNPPTG